MRKVKDAYAGKPARLAGAGGLRLCNAGGGRVRMDFYLPPLYGQESKYGKRRLVLL